MTREEARTLVYGNPGRYGKARVRGYCYDRDLILFSPDKCEYHPSPQADQRAPGRHRDQEEMR
jgi:hypothetical protein